MRFVIVTGMSGAGKSTALRSLEDMGYFCVDNLPAPLIQRFAEMTRDSTFTNDKVAIGIDIRNGAGLEGIPSVLAGFKDESFAYEILFIDADTPQLVKRYKETRREHPLGSDISIEEAIARERKSIAFLKDSADYIIDTSGLITRELKGEIAKIFEKNENYSNVIISLVSFGYKFGIPSDADIVFDVRFMPNPYYDTELRPFTGNDKVIRDFVMDEPESREFIDKLYDMLKFLIPQYVEREDRHHIVIAIGCTGGRHRSVSVTNIIYDRLGKLPYSVKKYHRDIDHDRYVKGEI